MKNESEFKKKCHDSIAVKLMLPNLHSRRLSLGKKSGLMASIAYCAWKHNNLERLDYLIKKFSILEKGTQDFKNRLEEMLHLIQQQLSVRLLLPIILKPRVIKF